MVYMTCWFYITLFCLRNKINGFNIYFIFVSTYQGQSNGYAPRFLGFSFYDSNTTNKSDATLCFKDTNFT